jgi:Protein of unknown function (DUF1638)
MTDGPKTLFIACGALAKEFLAVSKASGWGDKVEITCLPAIWHNRPEKIAPGVQRKIRAGRKKFDRIFVLYGDCGTGGELDRVLAEEGVERIEGPHCYQWFAGTADFEKMMDEEPGTFFLTDYLARHFERLIWQGFGIERHPELRDAYFGNYRKLVYLAQTDDEDLVKKAKAAAERLNLEFVHRRTGYGEFADFAKAKMA